VITNHQKLEKIHKKYIILKYIILKSIRKSKKILKNISGNIFGLKFMNPNISTKYLFYPQKPFKINKIV
jgi:hypothetical protein